MTIIITKENAEFIRYKMNAKALKIVDETKNTLHVSLTKKAFFKLYDEIKLNGINPFAVMSW